MTGLNLVDAPQLRVKMITQLPQTPEAYYSDYGINSNEWKGGEVCYHNGSGTGSQKLYIQTSTSGRTPVWRTRATQFVVS
jgi:hypothetical protein